MDLIGGVYVKAGEDNIFFLAGCIAFSGMLAVVPILLLVVAAFGYLLPWRTDDPPKAAVEYLVTLLPPSPSLVRLVETVVADVIRGRGAIGAVGLVLFLWSMTRLVSTLRVALSEVFENQDERGLLHRKWADFRISLVSAVLILGNLAITAGIEAAHATGSAWLGRGHDPHAGDPTRSTPAQLLAFAVILACFSLVYRYVPVRRPQWRTALLGASVSAVLWELLKAGFAWYVSDLTDYRSTYGSLAVVVVASFWVYYSAMTFVLGAEVAHVLYLRRTRRAQREVLG